MWREYEKYYIRSLVKYYKFFRGFCIGKPFLILHDIHILDIIAF